jgi:transmembrane sensor
VKQHDRHTELIAKHLAAETTQREKEELFAWMNEDGANKKFFDEMTQVWEMSAGAAPRPYEADFEKAWAKIDDATAASPKSAKVVPLSKIMRRWRVAAAFLLALAAGLWWWNQPEPIHLVEVRTLDNEKEEVTLPDGSHIWLNDHSTLTYDARFAKRNVTLDGEAFFEVERIETSPFRIFSGNVTTTVLGTSFNVRAYAAEKQVEVTVETGRVGLAPVDAQKSSVVLAAGTSGIFDKTAREVRVAEEKMPNALAWKTRLLRFDDTLMKDIIETLERYFEVDISVSNDLIYECHYTVSFEQPGIEDVLSVLSGTFNLEITRNDGGYLLSGEGCR